MLRTTVVRQSFGLIRSYVVGSGPHGVEGRAPRVSRNEQESSGGVAVTEPFLVYQNYVLQGLLEKDERQLRVMKEFQKLYHRVIGYTPPDELEVKISLLLKQIEVKYAEINDKQGISFSRLFQRDPVVKKNELVAYLTDEEELKNIVAPQGLLVNGEVGCGKSMLLDIFAASLPYESKMRWHYNNFILWVFQQIHVIQNERNLLGNRKYTMQNEFILFEIAQKMIQKNTVLILDEFMLPDIALANIIKILFTYYFKLGGVLVATSNKLPEELYSNQFHKTSFDKFVGILHSRCLTIDMKSEVDYRCKFSEVSSSTNLVVKLDNAEHEMKWKDLIKREVKLDFSNSHQELTLTVYGRKITIKSYLNKTVCLLDYRDICQGQYSSADYITLASTFPTIILDNVPIMTTKMKNEARRFISLLDAIYEAKCQLYMRSDVNIDHLFFPDVLYADDQALMDKLKLDTTKDNRLSVQEEEMYSKTTMAMESPYRPNVSTYDVGKNSIFNEVTNKPEVDFKDSRAFTGEDEKFAYKRAVLRIKEMIGSDNWRASSRWVPLDRSMRPWEKSTKKNATEHKKLLNPRDIVPSSGLPLEEYRENITPKITDSSHFWKMGYWTSENGKRLKDKLAKTWLNTSIRNDK